jgi:hypothetical protein
MLLPSSKDTLDLLYLASVNTRNKNKKSSFYTFWLAQAGKTPLENPTLWD